MSFIRTYTGKAFDFNNISAENINVEDIFISLPRLNRYLGHTSRAYSVGEHTIHCLTMAKKLNYTTRELLLTLIHDFTEAYVGDCPAPLKALLPEFSVIEEKVELAICEHLEIEPPTEEEKFKVKQIDLTMLIIEMKYITVHDYVSKWNNVDNYVVDEMIDEPDFILYPDLVMSEKLQRLTLARELHSLLANYKAEKVMS